MGAVAGVSYHAAVEGPLGELRRELKARNLGNKQIAWILGRDPSLVSKFLNGRHPIAPEYLHKLCVEGLGLRPGDEAYSRWFRELSISEPILAHEHSHELFIKS